MAIQRTQSCPAIMETFVPATPPSSPTITPRLTHCRPATPAPALWSPEPEPQETTPTSNGLCVPPQTGPTALLTALKVRRILRRHYANLFVEMKIKASDRYIDNYVREAIINAKRHWQMVHGAAYEATPVDILTYHGVTTWV